MEFFRGIQWDIIAKTKLWFLLSGVTILAGLIAWGARGLNYGIDFTGGSLLRFEFATPLAADDRGVAPVLNQAWAVLGALNLSNSEVQVVGDDKGRLTQLYLRTPPVQNDEEAVVRSKKVLEGLRKEFGDKGPITDLGRESVGPVVGAELRNKAIFALVLGSVLIGIYITIRYEFRFATAGVLALLHDALVATGAVALAHVELNSSFVAAILTILGFSMHDTVVIFDRIRENTKLHRRAGFAATVNYSLLQTMARSVNTVLTVLVCALALLLFGGESLHGFSLALIFGITTGCYSSIFFAPPLVVLWEARTARQRGQVRSAAPVVAAVPGPRRTRAAEPEAEEVEGEDKPVPVAVSNTIQRLQREEIAERQSKLNAEQEAKRQERRDRRQKEKERQAKKSGKPKRRF